MITVTFEEIAQYRSELSASPEALRALDMIEDCEGDLEDAAIALALQARQEPDTSDRWLEGLAKRCRAVLCQSDLRANLAAGSLQDAMRSLTKATELPPSLATPVIIYVLKTGLEDFCKPLEEKL
ncbi:hypothetical protein H6F93_32625 [Leptolyngbya sp. FACHB-671]|uniref:hypothetical protein n=1 Tax=unclassified Leptolyngbya TaxID=2650499 RepID=UPI001688E987|nr:MULTISPECIES: hypothetical protein [unclassified Leptolyngbya]MBD1871459.1 hypothetical protein [Cyanobacteria bacterium FACHB-471]MBD1996061.1 hypothetical protein [Leptolyngbya sp. FACHB-541]MBD2072217.1 hypothetical protein [Leptolyngbya sp. FACHB-671]